MIWDLDQQSGSDRGIEQSRSDQQGGFDRGIGQSGSDQQGRSDRGIGQSGSDQQGGPRPGSTGPQRVSRHGREI